MKYLLLIIGFILFAITLSYLTDYNSRMRTYNNTVCATYGKQSDCKTDRTLEQEKCDNFYGNGMCDSNGEVYPELTDEALEIQERK